MWVGMRVVAVGLIPAGAFATGVSDDETEEEVTTEPPEAECDGCWVGLGDGEDGVIGAVWRMVWMKPDQPQ